MLPTLKALADGRPHGLLELNEMLAKQFALSPEERNQRNQVSGQTTFYNRTAWARTYLKAAGLIESPKYGVFIIGPEGKRVLASKPKQIDLKFLRQFPSFVQFRNPESASQEIALQPKPADSQTPEEIIAANYAEYRAKLSEDLRERLSTIPPGFFENLVVQLLSAMGYGDARAVGGKGDGGIDGIVKEDKLGLDLIYVQAKRWEGTVPGKEIRAFSGSLGQQKASKGVFITTSQFSDDAVKAAREVGQRIVLIDGNGLAELMIDHGIGVSELIKYSIKKIDQDYFEAAQE